MWRAVVTLIAFRYSGEELVVQWWKSVGMATKHVAVEGMSEIECTHFISFLPSSVLEAHSAKEKAFFRLEKLPQSTIEIDNSLEQDGMVCCFEKEPDLQKSRTMKNN